MSPCLATVCGSGWSLLLLPVINHLEKYQSYRDHLASWDELGASALKSKSLASPESILPITALISASPVPEVLPALTPASTQSCTDEVTRFKAEVDLISEYIWQRECADNKFRGMRDQGMQADGATATTDTEDPSVEAALARIYRHREHNLSICADVAPVQRPVRAPGHVRQGV